MTRERIAALISGGHSVLAHKYNDLASCPICQKQAAVDRVLSALRSQVVEQLPDAPLLLKEDVLALIDEIQQKKA